MSSSSSPFLTFKAARTGEKCPFGNQIIEFQLCKGGCLWLQGDSGAGKTTLATFLAGLSSSKTLSKVHNIDATAQWEPTIPTRERCGVLFQRTTLLDELTVAGNLHVALNAADSKQKSNRSKEIKQLLESVGLDYARDASKRPTELSGGMGRRASLALQLAQKKRVIVLDEPFTGLDHSAAESVAKELVHLRKTHGIAIVLISHEPDLAALVLSQTKTKNNHEVRLKPVSEMNGFVSPTPTKPSLFGTTFLQRFLDKLMDYILWSLPLVLLTFGASGLAISMISADMLAQTDVTRDVIERVEKEVKPMIKMLTGEEPGPMTMMGVRFKLQSLLNENIPKAKAYMYSIGMAQLFVLEVGPLLTALLLSGRIGGSYAGKVATMQATAQTKLLRTLGISPQLWSLLPALFAALIAGPILTVIGTVLALTLAGITGPKYGIGTRDYFVEQVSHTVFPALRLRGFENATSLTSALSDLRPTFSNSYSDSLVEIATYPPVYHWLKASTYILIIMLVAEALARSRPNLTPRSVPNVITSSVVTSSLLVILADWAYSQLWMKRAW